MHDLCVEASNVRSFVKGMCHIERSRDEKVISIS